MLFKKNNRVSIQAYLSEINNTTDIREAAWLKEMWPSPISDNTPSWFIKQKAVREETGFNTIKVCPSYINTFKIGHVLKNMSEVMVEGVRDDDGSVLTNIYSKSGSEYAEWHKADVFSDNFPFPKGMIPASYKFASPFNYRVNRATNLIILPCWWDEENVNISAIQGMIRLSPNRDTPLHINTFMRQPNIGEKYVIPYGTPLAHIIIVDLPQVEYTHNQSLFDDEQAKFCMRLNIFEHMKGGKRKIMDNIRDFLIKKEGKDEN